MDRATILKSYGKDGQDLDKKDYDGTCRSIGLEVPPDSLDGADLANFDLVRRWFANGEVKNYAQARDRFNAQPKEGGVLLDVVAPLGRDLATETLATFPALAQQIKGAAQKSFVKECCEGLREGAQSSEFQQIMHQAVHGEAIDVDFLLLGGDPKTPQLPPSQP